MLAIFLILSACQAIVPTSSSDDFDFHFSMEADVPFEDDYDDYDNYDNYDNHEYSEGWQISTGSESNCQKATIVIMIGNVQTIIMMSRKRKATPLQ